MTIDLLHPSREQLLTKWPEVSKLRDISQWTTEAELAWLAEAACTLEGYFYAEVGSYKGKSAKAICEGIKGMRIVKTKPVLFCIDRFQDATGEVFRANTEFERHSGMIRLLPMESEEGKNTVELETSELDLLFIDASHEKHDVLRDLQLWTPLVKEGGLIALHDCFPQDWPNNGIHQALLEFRPDFHLAIDSIACFYK